MLRPVIENVMGMYRHIRKWHSLSPVPRHATKQAFPADGIQTPSADSVNPLSPERCTAVCRSSHGGKARSTTATLTVPAESEEH
jgi:hypothetical protein